MDGLINWWRSMTQHPISHETREQPEIDLEPDALRFTYDALLKEYDVLWQEIHLRLQMEERSINYLLVLIGGVISTIQVFQTQSSQLTNTLNAYPAIYLALALISLLFPLTLLEHTLFLANLGGYIHYVLSPKINAIANRLSQHNRAAKEFNIWDSEQFPSHLIGVLKWDDYRPKAQYRITLPVFGSLAIFKYMFVCIPAIMFVVAFILAKATVYPGIGLTLIEIILSIVFLSFTLVMFIGILIGAGAFANVVKPNGLR